LEGNEMVMARKMEMTREMEMEKEGDGISSDKWR
jgi:hypothetical protein